MEILTGADEASRKEEERLARAFSGNNRRASVNITNLMKKETPKPQEVPEEKKPVSSGSIPEWKRRAEENEAKKIEQKRREEEARKAKLAEITKGTSTQSESADSAFQTRPRSSTIQPVLKVEPASTPTPTPVSPSRLVDDQTSSSFTNFKEWDKVENNSKLRYQQEREEAERRNKETIDRTKRRSTMFGGSPLGNSINKPVNAPPAKQEDESVKQFMNSLRKQGLSLASPGLSTSHGNLKATPSGRIMPVTSSNNTSSSSDNLGELKRSTSFSGLNYNTPNNYTNRGNSQTPSPVTSPRTRSFTAAQSQQLKPTAQPQSPKAQHQVSKPQQPPQEEKKVTPNVSPIAKNPFTDMYRTMLKQVENEAVTEEKGVQPVEVKRETQESSPSQISAEEALEKKIEDEINQVQNPVQVTEEIKEPIIAQPVNNYKMEVIPISFKVDAETCSLAGTFNNWIPHPMHKEGDTFVCEITIDTGAHHEYKFVVNGSEWVVDKTAKTKVDYQGNSNNVIN